MECEVQEILSSKGAWRVCSVLARLECPLHVHLVAEPAGVSPPVAQRTLSRLLEQNVVIQMSVGQQRRSTLNKQHPAPPGLVAVFDALEKVKIKRASYDTTRTLDDVLSFNEEIRALVSEAAIR